MVYHDRSRKAELQRILDEAGYQIRTNWAKPGQKPMYGDGLMYDFVILSDGTIVRTRRRRQQLWHVNNTVGNGGSWSNHWMLGPRQDLTPAQRLSSFALADAQRADGNIPRDHVVAHCEWPLSTGEARISPTYKVQRGQSACPGSLLHAHVAAYRALPDIRLMIATQGMPVYEVPRVEPTRIALEGTAYLSAGEAYEIDQTYPNSMAHLHSGLGFVELEELAMSTTDQVTRAAGEAVQALSTLVVAAATPVLADQVALVRADLFNEMRLHFGIVDQQAAILNKQRQTIATLSARLDQTQLALANMQIDLGIERTLGRVS